MHLLLKRLHNLSKSAHNSILTNKINFIITPSHTKHNWRDACSADLDFLLRCCSLCCNFSPHKMTLAQGLYSQLRLQTLLAEVISRLQTQLPSDLKCLLRVRIIFSMLSQVQELPIG